MPVAGLLRMATVLAGARYVPNHQTEYGFPLGGVDAENKCYPLGDQDCVMLRFVTGSEVEWGLTVAEARKLQTFLTAALSHARLMEEKRDGQGQ